MKIAFPGVPHSIILNIPKIEKDTKGFLVGLIKRMVIRLIVDGSRANTNCQGSPIMSIASVFNFRNIRFYLRNAMIAGAISMLVACAGGSGGGKPSIVVTNAYSPTVQAGALDSVAPQKVEIEGVRDTRGVPYSWIGQRTAFAGTKIDDVIIYPRPTVIVYNMLEAELTQANHIASEASDLRVIPAIRRFQLTTPATALYWDVTLDTVVSITVVNAVGGRVERRYAAKCVERTYVWPGNDIVSALVGECMRKLGGQLRRDAAVAQIIRG